MGYTDFLWVVILTAGIKLGFAPEGFSLAVGIACFAGTMAVCYRLSRILLDPSPAAWLPIVFLAVNHSFSSYATGGMETQLQTALALLAMLLAAGAYRRGQVHWGIVAAYPVIAAAAILTRYNSALLLLPSALLLLYVLYRQEGALSGKATKIATAAIAGVVLLLPVFMWFQSYYGGILPNTFYAKAAFGKSLKVYLRGLIYIAAFFLLYLLVVLVPVVVSGFARLRGKANPLIAALIAQIALQCVYIVWAGGDFMEFRFLVPVMPAIYILAAWCLCSADIKRAAAVAVVGLLVVGSLVDVEAGKLVLPRLKIGTTRMLNDFVAGAEPNWSTVGRTLAGVASAGGKIILAASPVGAIPYYSGLPTIDMLGLNDPWVARHGLPASSIPGHRIVTPGDYLVRRGVNLVLGRPWVGDIKILNDPKATADYFFEQPLKPGTIPPHGCVVFIPVRAGMGVLAYYLTQNPTVEMMTATGQWAKRCS